MPLTLAKLASHSIKSDFIYFKNTIVLIETDRGIMLLCPQL